MSIVKDPHPIGQGAEQRAIVAHDDHGAVVPLDCVLQCFDRLDVEVVRWLVENEQVCARQHHHRECHPRALSAGQRVRASLYLVAGEPEATEMSLNLPALPRGPKIR